MLRGRLALATTAALLLAFPAVQAAASGPLSDQQAQAVRAFVRDALQQLKVPGAAVVIVGTDGIEFAEGFGTARDDGTPVTPQTPFEVASLSKQLTSIGVMQLVADGTLNLDATVHSYIDWFGTDGSDTAKITVRDLVAQTSGWSGDLGVENRIDDRSDDKALERNVRRIAAAPLSHPIGQFEYSNANYDVLGYLIAVVSGESYEAYMAERVFSPLQMTHTHTSDADAHADGLAQGHYSFFGQTIGWDIPFVRGSLPSSFIAASAEDLGHVLIAHLGDGEYGGTAVLDAKSMALLRHPLTHPDPWDGYGWGWWTYPLWNAGRLTDDMEYALPVMLEHGGSHATYASGMALLPKEGIGVVVLLNLNDENAPSRFYQLHVGIAQILLGQDAPAISATDDFLAQYGKPIGIGWVLILLLFVAWSVRRYRRWRRDPASAPRGWRAVTRRMLLPLVVVIGQFVGAWLLISSRGAGVADIPRLARLAPDLGLLVILISLISLVWIVVGCIWTIRLLLRARGSTVAP